MYLLTLEDNEYKEFWSHVKYMEVGSNIIPYVSPEDFAREITKNEKTAESFTSNVFSKEYKFSGKYGKNLMEEVTRYALVASAMSFKEEFDVIHAHDWLSYPAGIAAKKSSENHWWCICMLLNLTVRAKM